MDEAVCPVRGAKSRRPTKACSIHWGDGIRSASDGSRRTARLIRRASLAWLHRWLGLALAAFLLPACIAGSVLAWKPELDRWLNPDLFLAPFHAGAPLDEPALRAALKAHAPAARIAWIEPPAAPGRSAIATVGNWPGGSGDRRINEVFLDPATGAVLGARSTVTPSLSRAEFLPWLRRFHYTLGLGRTGMLLMGGVAIAWLVDSLLGTVLTVPGGIERARRWLQAWRVRRERVSFDLHRASALWLWPALIVLALSSVYLNLAHEVFVPALEFVARILPDAWEGPVVSTLLEWQQPLHTGAAFGLTGRVLVCIAGAVAALGIIVGLLSWIPRWGRNAPRRR
jgi:uncharacterized iron-regulated membrane protein